ncbi:hypothetical protein ACFLVE_01230 [Chloroflexota bacterium]
MMNAVEFIDAINEHAPPEFPRADHQFLKRSQVILGSGPYYQGDIPKAISLLGIEFDFLSKLKTEKGEHVSHAEPPVALSQIVIIHNPDREQCHRIRQGLFQTGLINFAGLVYVNFSPFTHRTVASLPEDAFAETDYQVEYSIFEDDAGEGKTRPWGQAPNPVFFAKGLDPTLVQLYFLVDGHKQPDFGPREPLPRPLYRAFLDVDAKSSDKIMEFMNRYGVFLFSMVWGPGELEKYVANMGETPPQMGIIAEPNELSEFWAAKQKTMRGLLTAAAQGEWRQIQFPPVFPICENAPVEWRLISGYFDPGFSRPPAPEQTRLALFQFKEANTDGIVRVRRYYGWDSYMWAELAEDIYRGKTILVCQNCGRPISPGKHGGRLKRFCSRGENVRCYQDRKAKGVRVIRSRRKK